MQSIVIARIRKPFGTCGEFSLHSFSGEWKHFLPLKHIELVKDGRVLSQRVQYWRPHRGGLLLKLEGIDTREDAVAYAQWDISVAASHRAPTRKGEYYVRELSGMQVFVKNKRMGSVVSVYEGGGATYLELRIDATNKNVLIPFLKHFFPKINRRRRKIYLKEPWILA